MFLLPLKKLPFLKEGNILPTTFMRRRCFGDLMCHSVLLQREGAEGMPMVVGRGFRCGY